MPARSSWKGFLRLSLVSIPVKAFTANATSSEIRLNQLHRECHSRIKYQKVCPIHGEVSNDEIESGYEYAKGQYVVIDPQELEALRTESDKAINIDTFVEPDQIDPIYYSGRNYFLAPDGAPGEKPYSLFLRAMVDESLYCVGNVVMHGKEQLVLLRPLEKMLCMAYLNHASAVKDPAAFDDEFSEAEFSKEELRLTKTLIEASRGEQFKLEDYKNKYHERLTQLIEAKVAGQEIVETPAEEPATVINLMDALKASVAQATASSGKSTARGTRKMAASSRKRAAAKRKKKTS